MSNRQKVGAIVPDVKGGQCSCKPAAGVSAHSSDPRAHEQSRARFLQTTFEGRAIFPQGTSRELPRLGWQPEVKGPSGTSTTLHTPCLGACHETQCWPGERVSSRLSLDRFARGAGAPYRCRQQCHPAEKAENRAGFHQATHGHCNGTGQLRPRDRTPVALCGCRAEGGGKPGLQQSPALRAGPRGAMPSRFSLAWSPRALGAKDRHGGARNLSAARPPDPLSSIR